MLSHPILKIVLFLSIKWFFWLWKRDIAEFDGHRSSFFLRVDVICSHLILMSSLHSLRSMLPFCVLGYHIPLLLPISSKSILCMYYFLVSQHRSTILANFGQIDLSVLMFKDCHQTDWVDLHPKPSETTKKEFQQRKDSILTLMKPILKALTDARW